MAKKLLTMLATAIAGAAVVYGVFHLMTTMPAVFSTSASFAVIVATVASIAAIGYLVAKTTEKEA